MSSGRFSRLEMESRTTTRAETTGEVLGTPVRTAQHDLTLADEAWRSGRFEVGLQMYTRALRMDRSLVPAWVGQVQMLVELAEYPEARLWADKALELFRSNGELLATKAQACRRQGDLAAASACADESLRSPGSSARRWRIRGEVILGTAPERARDCFERSLTEEGADWFDRVTLARVHLFYRLPAAALRYAQQGLDLRPSDPYPWLILGRCQLALGMREHAAASFGRCRELPGGRADADAALKELRHIGHTASIHRRIRGLFRP